MVQVVVAIIERDGRVLIGQRRPEQLHPLEWEFPGGKLEAGETLEQTLARELEEELAIRNARGTEITRYEFIYPGKKPITLIFYRVTDFEGEPQNLIYRDMRWQARAELPQVDFVEGDHDFIRSFAAGVY